ncbi:MAG: ATP-binding protein, partial [Spirochaetota bacterium]
SKPYPWVTLLGENGCGKSTIIQSIGLLLAGPEGAQTLVPRPEGWLRDEEKPGKLSIRIHQGEKDPGQFGQKRIFRYYGYTFFLTGSAPLKIRNKVYTEPTIVEQPNKRLTWLRQNAFKSKGEGWFSVGYGAFRRLTRSSQVIIPSLQPAARYTNFITQFNEDEPLSAFEQWMVYLDYRIIKEKDKEAKKQKELGVAAINEILPGGTEFHGITSEGKILYRIGGQLVPTISMSDGYRSILALAGDLVWRLIQAFPGSANPLQEEGVVLIDELDIHLHPAWQREIGGWLRKQFPNIQFIVATHSPIIAAGAGEDALTYKFTLSEGVSKAEVVKDLDAMAVDRILMSKAFGLVSPYSPVAQAKIDKYDQLMRKGQQRSPAEEEKLQLLLPFIKKAIPIGGPVEPGSTSEQIDKYIKKVLK